MLCPWSEYLHSDCFHLKKTFCVHFLILELSECIIWPLQKGSASLTVSLFPEATAVASAALEIWKPFFSEQTHSYFWPFSWGKTLVSKPTIWLAFQTQKIEDFFNDGDCDWWRQTKPAEKSAFLKTVIFIAFWLLFSEIFDKLLLSMTHTEANFAHTLFKKHPGRWGLKSKTDNTPQPEHGNFIQPQKPFVTLTE